MLFYAVYISCIVILYLHFSGFLIRHDIEWLILVAAGTIFAVNIFDYLNIL